MNAKVGCVGGLLVEVMRQKECDPCISIKSRTFQDEERNKTLTEIFDIWAENLWKIGVVGMVPLSAIAKINLKNVNTGTFTANASVGCGNFNRLYQLFWKK